MELIKYATRKFFESVTLFGTPIFYGAVLVYMAVYNLKLALLLLVPILANELLCALIKLVYRKKRPLPRSISNVKPSFIQKYDAGSFPSIHSSRIMLLAVIFSFLFPITLLIVFNTMLAILVGCSRIFLKEHFAADVVAGYVIGTIVALAFIEVSKQFILLL